MVARASIDALAATVLHQHPDLVQRIGGDGTLTLLFGDLEGGTEMTEPLGGRETTRNQIVRKHASIHGGFELALDGDSFLLAFANARQAVWCAIALQRAFTAHRATRRDRAQHLRIGLHTAEAIDQAVRLAAGIASQARGGEIVVSSDLKERIERDELGRSVCFVGAREAEVGGAVARFLLYTVQWGERGAGVSPEDPA